MEIEKKKERPTDNMGSAGRVETGPAKIEQDLDRDRNHSNSYTRQEATTNQNLTPEQVANRTNCLRGDEYRKAAADGGKGDTSRPAPELKDASAPKTDTRNEHLATQQHEARNSDIMQAVDKTTDKQRMKGA